MKLSLLVLLVCLLKVPLLAADQHQVGTAASGRATSSGALLESIVGQPASGVSGDLTTGFLSIAIKPMYLAGDADGSGFIDISDIVFLIRYIFGGGPAPEPIARGDSNCDGSVDISDAVYLISFIFGSGAPPQLCR